MEAAFWLSSQCIFIYQSQQAKVAETRRAMDEGTVRVLEIIYRGKKGSINEDTLILKWKGKLSGIKKEPRVYSKIRSSTELRNYWSLTYTKANGPMNPSFASLWAELYSTRILKTSMNSFYSFEEWLFSLGCIMRPKQVVVNRNILWVCCFL